MLSLTLSTPASWVEAALEHLPELLIDHAHCEKKAASTALSLLFRYPEQVEMAGGLSELAREELRHFEQVLELLTQRGIAFGHQIPAPYASALMRSARKTEPHRLMDTLLVGCLIEARSCERMTLLADALEEESLARLYRGLLACEARHHRSYLHWALTLFGEADVRPRLAELSRLESATLAEQSTLPLRMHSGLS